MLPLTSALLIFVGTYTNKDSGSRGIYSVQFDPVTGDFGKPVLAAETDQPTFLALNPNGHVLYALGETGVVNGEAGGGAVAFDIDAATGQLAKLNAESTEGVRCAHLGVDATGHALILASYNGGDVTSFPLDANGRIGRRSSSIMQTGRLGPNTVRQEKTHPHSITISPDNRFAYVCDLGLDKIFCYQLDPATAALTFAGETASAPGAGPRHAKFSSDGRFFYAINELDRTVAVFRHTADTGALTPVQAISTLPADFAGDSICAEIRLGPDGRFVYGSNRGHDSIAVFARDQTAGTLTLVEIVPCGGKHPRNFNLSPDGRWLVCANRDTNNLVSYRVDTATGRLTPAHHEVTIPSPVCVLFVPGK